MEERFIENFKNGFPFLKVVSAATPSRGITVLTEEQQQQAVARYDAFKGKSVKFVPASGAASRMFKDLFEAREVLSNGGELPKDSKVAKFITQIADYPFYNEEMSTLSAAEILDYVVADRGYDYGNRPKGQILFHKYEDEIRTAFEEHLVEGALYARSEDGSVNIHFTVSPAHQAGFEKILEQTREKYEKRYGVRYNISFSVQDPSTDIIAVNEDNTPFLLANGKPLYRPGGHGALLKNLDAIDGDVIFLKNIDNVVYQDYLDQTILWKKVLAGKLIELREKIFRYLELLTDLVEKGAQDDSLYREVVAFLKDELSIELPQTSEADKYQILIDKLNRPIRVCGMVKNEGEPGGGPYIIEENDGASSLQILEGAQLDMNNPHVVKCVKEASHFNPVDVVCSTKNFKGEKFDLPKYVDPQTGFISSKSYEGRTLKAQELPGLWNGSMSNWNTLFVEVPLITFNPVKTVFDLMRAEHRAK